MYTILIKLSNVTFQDGDVGYFSYKDINRTSVSVILAKPLEDLVDSDSPQNVLKFRLVCDYKDDEDTVCLFLHIINKIILTYFYETGNH